MYFLIDILSKLKMKIHDTFVKKILGYSIYYRWSSLFIILEKHLVILKENSTIINTKQDLLNYLNKTLFHLFLIVSPNKKIVFHTLR